MSDIVARLREDIRGAMKSADKPRLGALRLLLAAVRQTEIDGGKPVDSAGLIAIVEKMLKQRRDSIRQYEAGGREDLAEKEREEIRLLSPFMPERLSEEAVAELVAAAIAETQATEAKDMGKVMAALKPKIAGRADMAMVSKMTREKLA